MKKLIIIGAGGQGKVVADIAQLLGYEFLGFLDDDKTKTGVIGKICEYEKYLNDSCFFIAIGNATARERFFKELKEKGACIPTLIHPNAVISKQTEIGKGTVVMAGAVINTDTKIGDGVIVNTTSSIDHDCVVDDFCHIAVGAHVCGTVNIGKGTWVGAGATIINNVDVCGNCMIGAGAVVVKNIEEAGLYKGMPAKADGGN